MEDILLKQIQDRHELEISMLRLQRHHTENEIALRQAKFDLREAQQAQVLYGGSFRNFLDKLSGKQEEKETALRHAVQKAEAVLGARRREIAVEAEKLAALQEARAQLPAWDALRTPENEEIWCRLEALYCMEVLTPMLENNHFLLLERRRQFNGTYDGEIKTLQTIAEIYSAPEAAGEACKSYILRLQAALEALGIPFLTGAYFDSPTAFLSAATKYTQMDRVNDAIAQTEAVQRLIQKVQQQLQD